MYPSRSLPVRCVMSLAEVRTQFAERWLRYVIVLAGKVDRGRADLVRLHPEFRRESLARSQAPLARDAVAAILAVLGRRVDDFAAARVIRGVVREDSSRGAYLVASAMVQGVSTNLEMAIAELLCDDGLASPMARLTTAQRVYLQNAGPRLETRTRRFLLYAQALFVTGRRPTRSVASLSLVSSND